MFTSVLVFDQDLRLRFLNAAAESLLSISAAKSVGADINEILVPDVPFIEAIRRALRENQAITERGIELRIAERAALIVDCVATPYIDPETGMAGVIAELTDVSHQHRLQLEENITARTQITDAVLRGLAHEVKNPLGGIRGAAQLLERAVDDDRYREYTQVIISETDRLRALVDRMLGPTAPVAKRAVNIHTILERVRQIVAAEMAADVTVTRDYDPSLPTVSGDPDLLVQVFLNIVRNAVQSVGTGSGSVTIRTRAQRKFTIGTQLHRLVVRTDVIDTGPGVDPKLAGSIFFPMVSGRADGSGLGLSIANTLIHRQGGFIAFESEPGHTTFSVWLPVENQR
jgi:two-component system nitrogen regulation sensor histidine kinase GlnL